MVFLLVSTRVWAIGVAASLIIASVSLFVSCSTPVDRGQVRVDMSTERDAGNFLPRSGDGVVLVSLPGPQNAWLGDTLALMDPKGDWQYRAPLSEVIRNANRPLMAEDTLSFFFAIAGSDGLRAEETEVRRVTWGALTGSAPLFRFGDAFGRSARATVRFVVDMNNQEVLGFFRPEAGDHVVVSGNFNDWTPEGLPLADLGRGIYGASLPVSFDPSRPLEYRFRIRPGNRRAVLVNEGWEIVSPRRISVRGSSADAPLASFSDLRRIVRLSVSTANLASQVFDPDRDILQARFYFDDETVLSDALFELRRGHYETALAVPLTVERIAWQLVTDVGRRVLSDIEPLDVGPQGMVLEWPK
jgi:hypothetical protein